MQAKKKRILILLCAAAVLLCGVYWLTRSGSDATYENLIENGSFLETEADGMPKGWYTNAYFPNAGTEYRADEDGAHILSPALNDARFAQTVPVTPDSLYCLRGFIRANATEGKGANLSIEGVYAFSDSVYDSGNEWQEVFLYGRSGKKQNYVTVYARLGGYSGESQGEAWFRDITFNRVDSVPDGFFIQNLAPFANEDATEKTETETVKTGTMKMILACVAYTALFFCLKGRLPNTPLVKDLKNTRLLSVVLVLLFAFIARIACVFLVPGYDVDIGCFTSWASHMAAVGPVQFYNTVGFCDYPPGYMNILWIIGLFGNALGGVTEWMVKMPSVFCDTLICLLLYTEGKKRCNHRTGLILSLFFALNPVSFVSGACWGQTDSMMTLLLFISVLTLMRGKWKWALPVYVAAVLMKPQALMFGPMGVAALALHLKNNKCSRESIRDLLMGIGLSALVFCAMALPFLLDIQGEKQGLSFLLNLYGNTMSSYGYVTINACNPYFLLGLNWFPAENSASLAAVLTVSLMAVLPAVFTCIYHRRQEWKKDLSLLSCIGLSAALAIALPVLALTQSLSYAALSTCMIVYIVVLCCVQFLLKGEMKQLPGMAAAMLMLLFTCAGMMHERYLFPVIVLLLLGYACTKDKRLLYLSLLVSLASFLNIACVLDRNIRIGGAEGHLSAPLCNIKSDLAFLEYVSSVLISISAVLCTYTVLSPVPSPKETAPSAGKAEQPDEMPLALPAYEKPSIPRITALDVMLMLCGTVLYAVLAFSNLGSHLAPETMWTTDTQGESVVLDLGEERSYSVLYYPGIHWYYSDAHMKVESSIDGYHWESRSVHISTQDCFKWKYVTGTEITPMAGRYLRVSIDESDVTLHEILLRDAASGEAIPYTLSENYASESVANIMDEQNTLEGEPGWYNSAYFDEIYHARTGYEHLHGLRTYETSHPPFGKVLISWAIGLFGMNPFGWRFAGTLAGVLMLPGLYLLGKLLSKNKWSGLFAMLMMAFDLMHFTQTRIATIDSFVVLFIIWAVYFMLYWFRMDFFAKPFRKTLIPLGLSGLFFGFSIASKWTGVYNGVGLAVIFFWGIFRRWRTWKDAKAIPTMNRTEEEHAIAAGGWRMLASVGSCLVLFVFIPLFIYYLSYIPYFAWEGGVTVRKVIEAAVGSYFRDGNVGGMLGYHGDAGLGMDHPFYSPWWEWPVIAKPMWYSSSSFNTPTATSTILAMGNPAVWWVGLAGLLGVVVLMLLRHVKNDVHLTEDRKLTGTVSLSLFPAADDARFGLLIICFLAQYLPWMLVTRGTYIYHYFPSVPFIILCTLLCLDKISSRWKKTATVIGAVVLLAALALFIAFFPYASGLPVSVTWLERMKWFPGWIWY